MGSYSNILANKLFPEQFELVKELLDWLVPPVLEFVFYKAKLFTETSEIHLFYVSSSFFNVFILIVMAFKLITQYVFQRAVVNCIRILFQSN